ncbi:MAG: helicase-related protein, partial [Parasutterella excrementihominis]
MAGDLRDLKAKLLEARKAEKKPQAVSQKQEPPRTKLTLKKKTPAASSGASAASKSAEVKASAQKKNPAEPSKRPAPKGKGTSLKGLSDLRVLRNQINAPQEQKDINESKKPAASEKKPSRALVKVGNEVLRNIPPKLELQESLPVSERADEIAEAIKNNQVVIVSGETGSGKTTQLPKIAMMVGRGQKGLIGHTQPRRIAATSIAKRISEEMDAEVGQVAGYKIRFKDELEPGATIKLMTDGILLAETQRDRLLKAYDTIIIDEAHERSLNIDFLLGYLREILPKRPDLKLIITSATIDSERFAKHFESVNKKPVPSINVSGRLYPVQIRYRPVQDEEENDDRTLMQAIADACDELMDAGSGDILVFLPGEREIREAAEALSPAARKGVEILPLFSRLSIEEQDRIFKTDGRRRIVLATNIAETSLTVPGIRYVVDTGLARVKRYSYRNKVEQLQIEPISQAAAKQRAGRCGRVANGICIRLYDEKDFEKRPEFTDPEILRSSLATVILRMKSLHLTDVREFPFVQAPLQRAITDGYDL